MIKGRILIADDDQEIREIIRTLLLQEGYEVIEAKDGAEVLQLADDAIDLYVLDIMMPYLDGYQVCEELRKHSNAPILFLTAKGSQKDKAEGFAKGGDDYLPKPFSYSELLVRIQAMLRRFVVYQGKQAGMDKRNRILQVDELRIEEKNQEVYMKNQKITLTELEYQLLYFLVSHRHQVFAASDLYTAVWKEPYYTSANNTLMVHIRNLRKKIEQDPQEPKHLRTVWGKGYRFD